MAYTDFTVKKVKDELQIEIIETKSLFTDVAEIVISDLLQYLLSENVPLALTINTEKARSELIIVNILLEMRRQFKGKISLFSGVEFNVDKGKNLNGYCDYIISQSEEQLFVDAPVVFIVEAKNENIMSGLGQCMAEMVAAQIFNERENKPHDFIYGVVTSGNVWKFLKLDQQVIYLDTKEYYIENVQRIMGILSTMISQQN
jgi:hypothetical protein